MQTKTPADGIRYLALQVIETGEPQTVSLKNFAIGISGLEPDEVDYTQVSEMVEALKAKMTRSYASITINRMKEVIEIGKSASVKIGYDQERDADCITVGLKDGVVKHITAAKKQAQKKVFNEGVKRGLEMAISADLGMMDFTPDELATAQKVARLYKAKFESMIEGIE